MDEVAGAIADPVRREILLMLRDEPLAAGQIADRFAISRPAVSRHLRVLREAGLVRDSVDGRRRVYTIDTAPLSELAGWLELVRSPDAWSRRFDALETEVYRTRRERRDTTHREHRDTTRHDVPPGTSDAPFHEESA
ncbi:metalloregulator ArsR/SmtB family transcription factor [Actinoplanes sp. DH11]|uniref:metalloregulator ArsR/SmtB family transcription factor n=1 Tax=Actinoplanes sp. DH11 TaxID=2857011 RepID=UPI001E645D20|nr:metalloregulator ArsR/SmtB family transcription factor [Actinoplanes sp. DH11]